MNIFKTTAFFSAALGTMLFLPIVGTSAEKLNPAPLASSHADAQISAPLGLTSASEAWQLGAPTPGPKPGPEQKPKCPPPYKCSATPRFI